jgi:hypothetical protein
MSWVVTVKTSIPTAVRIMIDRRAATMANPFRERNKNLIELFPLIITD